MEPPAQNCPSEITIIGEVPQESRYRATRDDQRTSRSEKGVVEPVKKLQSILVLDLYRSLHMVPRRRRRRRRRSGSSSYDHVRTKYLKKVLDRQVRCEQGWNTGRKKIETFSILFHKFRYFSIHPFRILGICSTTRNMSPHGRNRLILSLLQKFDFIRTILCNKILIRHTRHQ